MAKPVFQQLLASSEEGGKHISPHCECIGRAVNKVQWLGKAQRKSEKSKIGSRGVFAVRVKCRMHTGKNLFYISKQK